MRAFLSYARADEPHVDDLMTELDRHGVPYWVDRRHIPVSVPWLDEVKEAIRAASVVVICQSFSWYESRPCQIELLTATDLGKPIVQVDILEQSAQQVGADIRAAVQRLQPVDQLHADLLMRSAAWDRSGRPSSELVRGKLLTRLQYVPVASRKLTSEAQAFLEASRKRARRRTLLRTLGVMFVVLCFLAGWLTQIVSREGKKRLTATANIFSTVADAHYRTAVDPYDGLSVAAEEIRRGNPGEMARETLVEALNVPVPATSVALPGARVLGLVADPRGPNPLVLNADGQVFNSAGAPLFALPAPITAVASSRSGNVLVWTTVDGVTALRVDGTFAATPCSGALLAVTSAGSTLVAAKGRDLCVSRIGGRASRIRLPDPETVTALAAGDDSFAIGTSSGDLLVIDGTGKIAARINGPDGSGPVSDLVLSTNARLAGVVHDGSGAVLLYDTPSRSLHRRLSVGGPITDLALSPDNRTVAVATRERITLTNIDSGQYRVALRGPRDHVRSIRWSPDGRTVWAVNGDARISQWPWHTGRRIADDPDAWFVAITRPGPDGRLFAITQTGRVLHIDPTADRPVAVAETGLERVLSASANPTNTQLLLGISDSLIVAVDPTSGAKQTIPVDGCLPISSAFASNQKVAIVGCYEGSTRRIDLSAGTVTTKVNVPYGGTGSIAIGSGDRVYIAAINGNVYTTDLSLSKLEPILESGAAAAWRSISASPDGKTLLVTGVGTGTIGYTRIGRQKRHGWAWYTIDLPANVAEQSRVATISPDGKYAAIGMADGSIYFWLLAGGGGIGFTRTEAPGAILGMAYVGEQLLVSTRQGVIDAVEPCTGCDSSASLLSLADQRIAEAKAMGLLP
jgi:WD40 repeat protein